VMQTINDYDKDVFNGHLGFVQAVDLEAQELLLDFDGRLVNYDLGELDEIISSYAITIHGLLAQGSSKLESVTMVGSRWSFLDS
jgi:ATP-dependent exoDNAse (exonuclease V) alpha subunit